MQESPQPPKAWRTPEELVAIGFDRSRLVLMNEAHNGFLRSVACRRLGARVLPVADAAGVRDFAMEALIAGLVPTMNETRELPDIEGGYLSQPDMRELVATALALGWRLHAYEISRMPAGLDGISIEAGNWRDDQHARNLLGIRERLGGETPLLVWCGNGHLTKSKKGEWEPMAVRLIELTSIDPFSIDQTQGIVFEEGRRPYAAPWLTTYSDEIASLGRAAGFLAEEAPADWSLAGANAYVFLSENRLS